MKQFVCVVLRCVFSSMSQCFGGIWEVSLVFAFFSKLCGTVGELPFCLSSQCIQCPRAIFQGDFPVPQGHFPHKPWLGDVWMGQTSSKTGVLQIRGTPNHGEITIGTNKFFMITWGRLWFRNLLVMYPHCLIIIHNPFISVYIPLCFDDLRIDVATQNINHPPQISEVFFSGFGF